MIAKDNVSSLMEKFKDNYKISEVCYIKSSKLLCLKILTLLNTDLDLNKAEIEGDIKKQLNLDINYNFSFINPIENEDYYKDEIIKVLKEKFNYDILNEDINVAFSNEIIITLNLSNTLFSKRRLLGLDDEIIKHLSKYTFKNIALNCQIKQEQNKEFSYSNGEVDILEDRQKLLNEGVENIEFTQKDFKIRGLDIVVGRCFTDVATCLNQIKSVRDFIQVAGKIRYFTERTFKKKVVKDDVEVEEERTFYTFELYDGFGKIKATYFPTKAFLEKEVKLEDNQIVTICGKIEEYRDNLTLKVKEIGFCCLPEGQIIEKSDLPIVESDYKKEDEISGEVIEYNKEPEKYMIAFPKPYEEPDQLNLFASLCGGDEVADMLKGKDYVVFDLETTGLDYSSNEILEIGAVKVRNGKIIEVFNTLCKPSQSISSFITELTGINDDMVAFAPKFEEIVGDFFKFTRNSTLVAHNSDFDTVFLDYHASKFLYKFDNPV
ncbi:MAG: exonuclease domain-containing protein, partial [Christensenellales bacterium]